MLSTETARDSREARVRAGDRAALAVLLQEQSDVLRRWVETRLDRRLRSRVSASDVVQDVYLAAEQRLPHFGRLAEMPFGVWVRLLAGQRLIEISRRYLKAEARALDRERPMDAGSGSNVLATRLAGHLTTPSRAASRHETAERLARALDDLAPADREVIALRHFQGLSNDEAAARLDLSKSAATKRYVRALARLKDLLEHVPGRIDETS